MFPRANPGYITILASSQDNVLEFFGHLKIARIKNFGGHLLSKKCFYALDISQNFIDNAHLKKICFLIVL